MSKMSKVRCEFMKKEEKIVEEKVIDEEVKEDKEVLLESQKVIKY